MKPGVHEVDPGREYWMVNRGSCFLAVVWFCSFPSNPSLPSVSSSGDSQKVWERETTFLGEGVGGGGAKSYDGEKVWSSINHSLLSVLWGVSSSHRQHYPVSPLVRAQMLNLVLLYTDKKENKIFLTYKKIQTVAVAKSHIRKGFQIYEEMRK